MGEKAVKLEPEKAKPFSDKLKDMVEDIRKNAEGITCEDCEYVNLFPGGNGYCHKFVDEFSGTFLRTSAGAPACDHHPRLIELKASIGIRSRPGED